MNGIRTLFSISLVISFCSYAGNLKTTTDPNAVCNDGQQATYSVQKGSTNKWVVILPGGGIARNADEYHNRPSYLKQVMKNKDGHQPSDGIEKDFNKKGYNIVFIPYCSSDVYAANHVNIIDGKKIPFRGRIIVEDVIKALYSKLKNADEVVFAGYSAGAIGIGMHAPLIGEFDNVRVLLDSFWFDEETLKFSQNFAKNNDRSFIYRSSMALCNGDWTSCFPSRERFKKYDIDDVFLIWSIGDLYSRGVKNKSALKQAIKSDINYYGAGYSLQAEKRKIHGFDDWGHVLAWDNKTYSKKYFKMSLQKAVNNWLEKKGDAIVIDY